MTVNTTFKVRITINRYGFLSTGYEKKYYYWEYVVIYRKLLIITVIVLFAQVSLFLQALSSLGILLVSVTLQSKVEPYSQSFHNSLETRSLLVATLTLYSGLFFYNDSFGDAGATALFAFVAILNVIFTAQCIAKLSLIGLAWLRQKSRKKKIEERQSVPSAVATVNWE